MGNDQYSAHLVPNKDCIISNLHDQYSVHLVSDGKAVVPALMPSEHPKAVLPSRRPVFWRKIPAAGILPTLVMSSVLDVRPCTLFAAILFFAVSVIYLDKSMAEFLHRLNLACSESWQFDGLGYSDVVINHD